MVFGWFKSREPMETPARALYRNVVERMREPVFYTDLGVPDTLEGRFDLLLVHAFTVFHRITKEGEQGKPLGQSLFDLMIADLDQNLREMGIGDEGVRHRIKAMTEAYHGRIVAYEEGLRDDADEGAFRSALDRNLYGTTTVAPEILAKMESYLRDQVDTLAGQSFENLSKGNVRFAPVPQA